MADNVIANPGAGGSTFRSLDDGTAQWPANVVSYATTLTPGANVLQPVTSSAGLPVAQQGSWSVSLSGTAAVTQSGAWSVSVSNFPATQAVTGTFWQATQPVSIAAAVATKPDGTVWALTGTSANVNVTNATVAVTQSGAWSLAANQSVNMAQYGGTNVGATNAVHVQPGTGASFTVAQATPASLQATATQALGSAATRWFAQISDGTNSPAVKAASTAAAFTDPALTVDPRPGGALVTASAAMADAFANPTLGKQAVVNMVYNGSTWDLQRGMSGNLTTGDTGAKVATGNGATIANVGNKGIQLVVNMGAVTGTTPTCVIKMQGSADGGTTWYDIPGATTASLTATGVYGITVYPGIAVTAGTTTTGTTATANVPLPRTWRVVWTIGGTTPSFTITNIQYNYIPN